MNTLLAALSLQGNTKMLLGIALVAGVFLLSNDKVKAVLSNLFNSVVAKVKSIGGGGTAPTNGNGVVTLVESPLDAHRVVTALMAYFSSRSDKAGIQYSAAVGQHIYSKCCDESLPAVPTSSSTEAPLQWFKKP